MSAELLFTHGPANVGTLLATTLENRRDTIADAVFSKHVLLNWLNQKGRIVKRGGASIVGAVIEASNSTAESYDDGDTLTTTHQEEATTYQYRWKQYSVSINLFGREERVQNAGASVVHDIVQTKLDVADRSLAEKMNTDLFAGAPGAKDLNSLVTLIDATSTIGDIDSSANTFWQSDVNAGGSFSAEGLKNMRDLWYDLSKLEGAGDPDLLLTTSDVFGFYESQLVPQQRYQQTTEGNGSFMNLLFKSAPVMFDTQATSGVIYYLNSEVLKFCTNSDTDFALTPWVKPSDQDIRVAQILFAGQMLTDNRRKLGKITGVTA